MTSAPGLREVLRETLQALKTATAALNFADTAKPHLGYAHVADGSPATKSAMMGELRAAYNRGTALLERKDADG